MIRYTYTLPRPFWSSGCNTDSVEEAIHDLRNRWKVTSKIEVIENDTLKFEHMTCAIRKSRYGNHDVFINSIANLTQYPGLSKVLLEDGRELPREIVEEIIQVGERIADFIHWEPNDIAMIDNSRILHGRRAFSCARKVETRFSNVA